MSSISRMLVKETAHTVAPVQKLLQKQHNQLQQQLLERIEILERQVAALYIGSIAPQGSEVFASLPPPPQPQQVLQPQQQQQQQPQVLQQQPQVLQPQPQQPQVLHPEVPQQQQQQAFHGPMGPVGPMGIIAYRNFRPTVVSIHPLISSMPL